MRRISILFLCASLALAEDYQFYEVRLISDASRRYMVDVQMGAAAQHFNFALTTSTPFATVAGPNCTTCGGVESYNQQSSPNAQTLNTSADVSLIGGASTSGSFVQEDCALHAINGSSWIYPQQPVIVSNQSSQVYGGQLSGLFGLSSGWSTGNLNMSIIGRVFGRQPNRLSVAVGLALQPPNAGDPNDAGILHWFGSDPDAYEGDIIWKITTTAANSDIASFDIDGWLFWIVGHTITNSNQDLNSTVDPYYVNMFFPSQEAQVIHSVIQGSSSKPANDGQSTVYVVPCDAKYFLSITIGGKIWKVDEKFLVQKQDDGTCVSNIQGWADVNNKQYLFGSAFLSSLYLVIQVGNPNRGQSDQIGFAKRASPPSLLAPVVGGVVGGVCGIGIISLAIFFLVRRCGRRKSEDMLDSEDRDGKTGRFAENKDAQTFPYTIEPMSAPLTSPTAFSYPPSPKPSATPGFAEGVPQSPHLNNPNNSRLTPVRTEHGPR